MDSQITNAMPEHLELNEWIQLCLDSENEVLRQIALEELSATGIPPYLNQKLREMSGRDPSSVCRQLAGWVCGLDEARATLRSQIRKLELSPANIQMLLDGAEPATASALTQFLRKSPSEETLATWRSHLLSESNSRILQIGLTILGKFGQESDFELAEKFLLHSDQEVVCAALGLLQQQNVEAFKRNLRAGLTSKSFKIQLHAVHLLRIIDVDEAIKYICAFLSHKNPLIRQRALRELVLVPFDKISHILIQYLSAETNPLLLIKAGFLVAFNPVPDFPLKLYDILNLARDSKKHILQLILKQNIEAVTSAGIIKMTRDEYLAYLQQKLNVRRSEMTIRCAAKDLASTDESIRSVAVEKLVPFVGFQSVRTALENHLKTEKSEEIVSALEVALGISTEKTENNSKTFNIKDADSIDLFLKCSVKEQKSFIKNIKSFEQFTEGKIFLLEILQSEAKKPVMLEVLRCFSSYGTRLDTHFVLKFLESNDPSIAAATIKAIGNFDLDAILPKLNLLLANDDPRVKSSALEVYVQADKEGAVQYLSSMLKSTSLANRRLGLSLLPQLDYPSAEPLLWNLLKYEANGELKQQAGYMVAANPTYEGVKRLFNISHKKDASIKPGYEEIWSVAKLSAESVFDMSAEEIEKDLINHHLALQEAPKEDKSAYSFSSVVGESGLPAATTEDADEPEFTEKLYMNFVENKSLWFGAVLIIFPLIYMVVFQSSERPGKSTARGRLGNVSAAKFYKNSKTESVKTQVGGADWKGTLKSGARELLSGSAYSAAIRSGFQECEDIREDYDQNLRQYYMDLANNPNEPEEARQLAEANLNPYFAKGMRAWEEKSISEAELNFEKAIDDPALNTVGKCFVLQKLAEMAENKKDKVKWIKWQDRLMKELKKMPGYENISGFDNFAKTYGKLMEVGQYVSHGGDKEGIVSYLKERGESEFSARQSIESLKKMDNIFDQKK